MKENKNPIEIIVDNLPIISRESTIQEEDVTQTNKSMAIVDKVMQGVKEFEDQDTASPLIKNHNSIPSTLKKMPEHRQETR